LEAAQAQQNDDPTQAIAYANGAATLAAQAQSLANDDVRAAQRSYTSQYGGGGGGGSDPGPRVGGLHTRNPPRGGEGGGGGYGGGWGGGSSPGRPTSYGGSSRSSTRSYSGGSGRF